MGRLGKCRAVTSPPRLFQDVRPLRQASDESLAELVDGRAMLSALPVAIRSDPRLADQHAGRSSRRPVRKCAGRGLPAALAVS